MHHFDHSYQHGTPTSFSANFTQPNTFSDPTWYPDLEATHHITHNFNNLNHTSEPYYHSEQIQLGDGSGPPIQNTGDSSLYSPSSSFLLKNLLHVPNITKNFISVSKFCNNNTCYFEFHASFFYMKDTSMGKTLLTGPICDGLYIFPLESASPSTSSSSPSINLGGKTSVAQWHRQLGHPHHTTLSRILYTTCLKVTPTASHF